MRQVAAPSAPGARPASRARARSPASGGPSTRSQAAAYGFQSPAQNLRASGGGATGATSGTRGSAESNNFMLSGTGGTSSSRPAGRGSSGAFEAAPSSQGRAARNSRLAVVVRKRPMNRREVQASQQDVVLCRHNSVFVREPKLKVDLTRYVEEHNFLFDQSFDETVSNEQLYQACVRPIIDAVFNRAKCTCFAYGQTGSGKTFTMMGPPRRQGEGVTEQRTPGIFLLAAQDIFGALASKDYEHLGVYISFYEIYCGKLFDLLNNRQILQARENAKANVVIVGLQEHPVENVQELMEVIEFGLNSRTTGVTGANVDSSRSHAILQISLRDSLTMEDGRPKEHGKINFIDLAGSERGADTLDTDRQTRMDGAEINKSLLALKECIRALDQQSDHTPFRGSKLTQVLKDSFIGTNCRTVMIANVSPCSCAVEHSLNTLRYAYRVKELRRPGASSGALGAEQGSAWGPTSGNGLEPLNAEIARGDSSDEGSGVGGTDTPPSVSQEMRVAHLSAAAQTLSSPRERGSGRVPSSLPYHEETRFHERHPPLEEAVGCRGRGVESVMAGSGSGGARSGALHSGVRYLHQVSGHLLQAAPSLQHSSNPELAHPPEEVCSQAALDDLARQHDRLIGTILAEEEELITAHRQHIDTMVELIKEEMVHLNNVDRPGSDVDAYVAGLDRILQMKALKIGEIRERVDLFQEHLQQEDALSRKFQALASSQG